MDMDTPVRPRRSDSRLIMARPPCCCRKHSRHDPQGGKYGIRLSLGAQENEVYNNVMSDSSRYGVFFYRGSDEAEVRVKCHHRRVVGIAV